MRTTIRRAGAAAVTVMALAAPLGTGAAAATGSEPGEAAWVTVGAAPPGSTLETVRGTKDEAGNCVFTLSLTLAPKETAVRGDQVRVDRSTCVTEVALTRDGAASEAKASDGVSVETEKARPAPDGPASDTPRDGRRPYTESRGYLRTSWRDRSDADANGVRNEVDWYWNGQNCLVPEWGQYAYDWASARGWRLGRHDWRNIYNCSRQTSSSAAHFHNDGVFCPGLATDVHYDRNTVQGTWDGRLLGEWRTWVSGGCTGDLSFHYELRRTL
ncbi:hypothetical protein ACLGIH_19480 [Streptomyces sp. HMX87]|uniref:hypothetical protein n=1 Tax=Streptomyces sp. HMX87 TaxID=3390849 RepID=UPI003A8ADF94